MDTLTIFLTQFFMSLLVYAYAAKWYVGPWLDKKPLYAALGLLILPHALRYIGLTFMVPNVGGEGLSTTFAASAGYGDWLSAMLAIISLIALRKHWRITLPLIWVFNVVGTLDLINALRQAEAVSYFRAAWFIPTFFVPLLLVSHFMVFSRLLRRRKAK
ncbi:MAG: hypothetical protein COA69_10910 [Robiginitomaculum sp.]|nr:MAG: hypothetical protein COA69_10910 [Robiginitomaculum sp.]